MTVGEIEQIIQLCKANGITRFKSKGLDLRFGDKISVSAVNVSEGPPSQAIPPIETEIPHHVNEVMGLLKLSDEELVEKMWPEPKQNEAG